MYMYVYVCMSVCTLRVYVCICVSVCMDRYVCMHGYVYENINIYIYDMEL